MQKATLLVVLATLIFSSLIIFPASTVAQTATPTPAPTATPTPCNAWTWLTDVSDIALGYTIGTAGEGYWISAGRNMPMSQYYGYVADNDNVYYDDSDVYGRLFIELAWGTETGDIPEGYYFDITHDSDVAASPMRCWFPAIAWVDYSSPGYVAFAAGTDGTLYTDDSMCTVAKAPVTPTPTPTTTPTATVTPSPEATKTPTPIPTPSVTPTSTVTPSAPPTETPLRPLN